MLGSSVHLWSYKDGDAKCPLSQGKSLERLIAQTPFPHPFQQDTGHWWGNTSVQEPILWTSGLPQAWGTHREGTGQWMLPCSHK